MPQVNVANQEARNWLIDIGVSGCVSTMWMVSGWTMPLVPVRIFGLISGRPAKARSQIAIVSAKGDYDSPSAVSTYVGRLDGCLDFYTAEAMRRTFALGRWTEERLESFLARQHAFFPASFLMPIFIDNHDMDRFLFIANGDGRLCVACCFPDAFAWPPYHLLWQRGGVVTA